MREQQSESRLYVVQKISCKCRRNNHNLIFLLLLRLLQPGEELCARLDSNAFSLLLRGVVVLLPGLEAIFADNIIVVKLFEDGVQELVRMLQSLHKMLQGQKNRQLE